MRRERRRRRINTRGRKRKRGGKGRRWGKIKQLIMMIRIRMLSSSDVLPFFRLIKMLRNVLFLLIRMT